MCFHQFHLLCACFVFGCVIKCAYCSSLEAREALENSKHLEDHVLLQRDVNLGKIFAKYGNGDGQISYEGFQRLVKNLLDDRGESKCDRSGIHEQAKQQPHRHVNENLSHLPAVNVDEGKEKTLTTEHIEISSEASIQEHSEKTNQEHILRNVSSFVDRYPTNMSALSVAVGGKCVSAAEISRNSHSSHKNEITPLQFVSLCPAVLYELDKPRCVVRDKHTEPSEEAFSLTVQIWLFSTLAVVVISLCGLLSVAVVPLIHHLFYQSLLQFLIGLAVGSLSGDALLHLLPHAMTGLGHSDHQGATNTGEVHDEHHHQQETYIWTGLVALSGIYIFYIAERFLNLAMACYSGRKTLKTTSQVSRLTFAVRSMDSEQCKSVGEKLSHHKHGSYGYQFDPKQLENFQKVEDILDDQHAHEKLVENSDMLGGGGGACSDGEAKSEPHQSNNEGAFSIDQNNADNVDVCHTERVIFQNNDERQSCVVAVTDHHHHSHRHTHGGTISAVAWMVIMGDGLHNLCDGLAIGAAFVSGLSSGLSTTVAVFCHELPHELGDFALLLKAGMPVRQALLYNGLSSFLCFIGMLIGVLLGSVGSATLWVFAGAAGMFLYIALVDMLPELDNVSSQSVLTSVKHFVLQIFGIVLGVSIMLVIALYEHDLKHLIR